MSVVRRSLLAGAALAAVLLAAVPLYSAAQQLAAADPPSDRPHAAGMHQEMQQKMQKHLDRLAARLEIRASQQEAWNAFSSAVRGLVPDQMPERPADDVDAAARARLAADRAAERAKRLSQLADATARLQQALDAQQKQVLNEVARNFSHHLHDHGDGHWGMGMHGGTDHEHCDAKHEGHGHERD